MHFFDKKWAQNYHLLLNISNFLYFHSELIVQWGQEKG